jgi:uncharacterized membrane protein YeiB
VKLSKPNRDLHPTHMSHSPSVIDAVMRATGILALMGIAVIHLVQLVPTFEATPLLGGAFVLLIAGAVVVGARLISSKLTHAQLWLPVAALGVAALGGYVFTRVVSTPLDNQDVGNWACMLGIAALFVEGTVVALSAYALSNVPRRHLRAVDLAEQESATGEPARHPVRARANGSGR